MKKNYFICLFTIFVVILSSLYFNNVKKDNIQQNDDIDDISNLYDSFFYDKLYLNDFDKEEYNNSNYILYDLDKNGVDELIIYLSDGTEFGTSLIYTYDDKVIFVDKIYHYGNLAYNETEESIVYTDVRPSLTYGSAYGFYQLVDNKLVFNKTLSIEIEDGVSSYFMYEDENDKVEISKETFDKYFDNNIVLSSMDIDA